ncbi:MAG: MFS transporter [Pseudomonadota bacterium]|nr:MFS transporter [Pseudomonadota bacterium]
MATPTPPRTRLQLLAAVVALEAASGMPFGVVNDLVPVWLKVNGVDTAAIGAMTLVGLPWTLKALWAPAVDRVGTYKSWIAAGLCGAASAVVLLPLLGPTPALLIPALLALAIASATQDVAIDGWLVSAVPADEQGRVTGVRVAAYRGAMALAGGGAVVIGDKLDWRWAFGAVAILILAVLPVVARLPAVPRAPPTPAADWLTLLRDWAAQPGTLVLFAFVLLYKLGDSAMAPMVKLFLVDTGLSPTEVGLLSTTAGAVLVAVGAIVGGDVLSRIGMARGVLLLGSLQALSNLGYAAAATSGTRWAAYLASFGESLTAGLGTAALLALAMRAATGPQAATRFAILTGIVGLTRTLAGSISGVAVARIGYAEWFLVTFLLALPALALVPRVSQRPVAAAS